MVRQRRPPRRPPPAALWCALLLAAVGPLRTAHAGTFLRLQPAPGGDGSAAAATSVPAAFLQQLQQAARAALPFLVCSSAAPAAGGRGGAGYTGTAADGAASAASGSAGSANASAAGNVSLSTSSRARVASSSSSGGSLQQGPGSGSTSSSGGAASPAAAGGSEGGSIPEAPPECTLEMRRQLRVGAATTAYQVEGGWKASGRGPSVWDTWLHKEGYASGDTAADHFGRFAEDVALMRQLGIKHYRFTISWSRVLPLGRAGSPVNKAGLAFYSALVDALLAAGITPFATLMHLDLPQALHEAYTGPLSRDFVDDFVAYADLMFAALGDRVKLWMTLNEPFLTCARQYGVGLYAPSLRTSAAARYACGHNLLLAHARAKALYDSKYRRARGGRVGIGLNTPWGEPMSNATADKAAALKGLDWQLGWFAEPLFLGRYPESLKQLVGDALPSFTKAEAALVKGSSDYLGLSYYTALFVAPAIKVEDEPLAFTTSDVDREGNEIGPLAEPAWQRIVPWGLRKLLLHVHARYGQPEVMVTSCGVAAPGEGADPPEVALRDTVRVNFYRDHLAALCAAKSAGSNVSAFYAWSLLDGFEWLEGYAERWGVVRVDYAPGGNLTRTPKDSARFLAARFWREGA